MQINKDLINNSEVIKSGNVYSTNETIIGTYSGKPVYRKVIEYTPTETIGSLSGTTDVNIPHNISNLKHIISCNSLIFRTDSGVSTPLPFSNGSGTIQYHTLIGGITAANIVLKIINDTWGTKMKFIITLEYTKTTD